MAPDVPHVWRTLGYRRPVAEPGHIVVEWDASPDYAFPADSGHIVHGGLVATILDTAMGGACWTLLEERRDVPDRRPPHGVPPRDTAGSAPSGRPRRPPTKRVMFCAAELYDAEGTHLASARCTQVLRSAR